jgi:hypothetical protein
MKKHHFQVVLSSLLVIVVGASAACGGPIPAKVIAPVDVLSAKEAGDISGFLTTLDGAADTNTAGGTISQRYHYDINNTGVNALVQIMQNGLKSAGDLQKGHTARWAFDTEKKFSSSKITPVAGIGDDAFTFNSTSQLHLAYKDYYIVIAFRADPYGDEKKDTELNIKIGRQLLANLIARLK